MKKAIKKKSNQAKVTVDEMLAAMSSRRKTCASPSTTVETRPILKLVYSNDVKVPISPVEVGMFILLAVNDRHSYPYNTPLHKYLELGTSFITLIKDSIELWRCYDAITTHSQKDGIAGLTKSQVPR